jgi:hypothetical protein
MKINERAAQWWADHLFIKAKQESLKSELLKLLPDADYLLYNDYDPQDLLLIAVRAAGINCDGYMFSGRDLFPNKIGLKREGENLFEKLGYGYNWTKI